MSNTGNNTSAKSKTISQALTKICETYKDSLTTVEHYKYIFALFVWKYMSDQDFRVPLGTSYYEIYVNRDKPKLFSRVDRAIRDVLRCNGDDIEIIFHDISFTVERTRAGCKTRDKIINDILMTFQNKEFNMELEQFDEDVVGSGIRYWLSIIFPKCFSLKYENYISEAYSNGERCDKVTKILGIIPKLVHGNAQTSMKSEEDYKYPDEQHSKPEGLIDQPDSLMLRCWSETNLQSIIEIEFYGFDRHRSTWALIWLNLISHQVDRIQLIVRESVDDSSIHACKELTKIARSRALDGEEVTISDDKLYLNNDPRSLDKWLDTTSLAECVMEWLDQRVSSVKDGFKSEIIFVLSEFRCHSLASRVFRRRLIEEQLLKFVIDLPSSPIDGLMSVSMIVLHPIQASKDNNEPLEVKFIDTFEADKPIVESSRSFDKFLNLLKTYDQRDQIDKRLYSTTAKKIIENNYDLTVSRYVTPQQSVLKALIHKEAISIQETEKQICQVSSKIARNLRLLSEAGILIEKNDLPPANEGTNESFEYRPQYQVYVKEFIHSTLQSIDEAEQQIDQIDWKIETNMARLIKQDSGR